MSNSFHKFNTSEKLIGQIVAEYHAIEKGLVMPDMRAGFGEKLILDLIYHCSLYNEKYKNENEQLHNAIRVLVEYKRIHQLKNQVLPALLKDSLNEFLDDYKDVLPLEQLHFNKHDYFDYVNSSFLDFSNSRHSLRNFSGPANKRLIKKAISLAQNAPSACNRQPARVYLYNNKETIKEILSLQNGNRGFGDLVGNLILITSEAGGFLSLAERNDIYTNGGIYAMNLLYALHYYKIGTCILNWSSFPDQDKQLRKVSEIRESESVILFIACGEAPDEFDIVSSPRCSINSVLSTEL